MPSKQETLQIVVEIVGDLVHQMYSPAAHDVVLRKRVWEVIHLDVLFDAALDETQAVLPDDGVVDRSLAYQQFSLQIGRLSDETGGSETIRICFLCVHVPFSVHDFVPFPVDYGTSGDTDLESLRIVRHQ